MTKHLFCINAIIALLVVVIFYPHFPGGYDPLAADLSLFAQLLCLGELLLVPWLIYEVARRWGGGHEAAGSGKSFYFGLVALVTGSVLALLAALIVLFGESTSLAICLMALCGWIVVKLTALLKKLKAAPRAGIHPAPLYLIAIPLGALGIQWAFAGRATNYSREFAILNSREIIEAIERHRTEYGSFPSSMNAVWKDYYPDVVGIETYHYTPSANAYSVSFEQPRFLFDDIGVREFVMYNKLDEHIMPSHASWILIWSPEQLAETQGWRVAEDATTPHWKRFLFD